MIFIYFIIGAFVSQFLRADTERYLKDVHSTMLKMILTIIIELVLSATWPLVLFLKIIKGIIKND